MRLLIIILVFMIGCTSIPKKATSVPKYKVGDCVGMTAMSITEKGEWDSSGYRLGEFKILEIIKTEKMNTYMATRLHANEFYKIQMIENKYSKDTRNTYVIPVTDLDSYRYASVFWYPEIVRDGKTCNAYPQD